MKKSEAEQRTSVLQVVARTAEGHLWPRLLRISRWNTRLRVVARIRRMCRAPGSHGHREQVGPEEMQIAEWIFAKWAQERHFATEI